MRVVTFRGDMRHSAIVQHGLDLSAFGTQVRNAVDVVWRGTPAFPNETTRPLAEDVGLRVPSTEEVEAASRVVEDSCRVFLGARIGETLELPVARSIYYMREWARLHVGFPDPSPACVCFGKPLREIVDRQRMTKFWASVEGRDGCLLVFAGRSRNWNCPACHASRRTRWTTFEAEANANRRGLLTYPVWYPDGSTGTVRVGVCGCGTEFQASVDGPGFRRTRCDECQRAHRVALSGSSTSP